MSNTATIAAKGTSGTGITEELAKSLHDNLGKTIVAVVEIRSESRGENLKGDETVKLAIQTLEVIPDDVGAAEHVRQVARAAFRNRKLAEDGPTLPIDGDGPEPTVADVLAHGQQHRPHPFLPVDASIDNGICDVCGQLQTAAIHAERTGLDDPFTIPDDEDDEDQGDDPEPAHDHEDEADCDDSCPAYALEADADYEPDPDDAA